MIVSYGTYHLIDANDTNVLSASFSVDLAVPVPLTSAPNCQYYRGSTCFVLLRNFSYRYDLGFYLEKVASGGNLTAIVYLSGNRSFGFLISSGSINDTFDLGPA